MALCQQISCHGGEIFFFGIFYIRYVIVFIVFVAKGGLLFLHCFMQQLNEIFSQMVCCGIVCDAVEV